MSSFDLFQDQIRRFINALSDYDSKIWYPLHRGKYEENVPKNWFTCFVPDNWGHWIGNYGVHFGLIYAQAKTKSNLPERFRFTIGVESPLKEQYIQPFKEEVISRISAKKIDQSCFTLIAMERKKLLETDPIPFNSESWQIALDKYIALRPIVEIIGEVNRKYFDKWESEALLRF
jgi:hypothetical protein